jgi:CRP/FNR family transcriptional regulator, cyclic AMP receptor protein
MEAVQVQGIVRVLEEAPDLVQALPPAVAAEARRLPVRVVEVPTGSWTFDHATLTPGHLGLLVLDGLLGRAVGVAGSAPFTELLGAGDLLRPWSGDPGDVASVPMEARWEVFVRSRLAVLDRRFALAVSRWPEVTAAILDRAVERSRSLVFFLAVCHLKRVEARLLVVLWHVADRWGRMTRDGVILPLPLTHKLLASMIGAHRPSVTTALGTLRTRGVLERRSDGAWLLRGSPPRELDDLRRAAAVIGPTGSSRS